MVYPERCFFISGELKIFVSIVKIEVLFWMEGYRIDTLIFKMMECNKFDERYIGII
jgi:hypothetical protein